MSHPLPFDSRVQHAFTLAYRAAQIRGHHAVTPVHLLLGVAQAQYNYRQSRPGLAGLSRIGGDPQLQVWEQRQRLLLQQLYQMLDSTLADVANEAVAISLTTASQAALRTAWRLARERRSGTLRVQHLVLALLDQHSHDPQLMQVQAEHLSPIFDLYGYSAG